MIKGGWGGRLHVIVGICIGMFSYAQGGGGREEGNRVILTSNNIAVCIHNL